jgi:hypothetical protein
MSSLAIVLPNAGTSNASVGGCLKKLKVVSEYVGEKIPDDQQR